MFTRHGNMTATFLLCVLFAPVSISAQDAAEQPARITNSVGMQLNRLNAGRFEMGARSTGPFRKDHPEFNVQDAKVRHQVVLTRPFYLSTTEVTRKQYAQFVADTGYDLTGPDLQGRDLERAAGNGMIGWDPTPSEEHPQHRQAFRRSTDFDWQHPGFDQSDDDPVVGVSYRDATAFCKWLSAKEGKPYRLPTEAEWEYAARANTTSFFSFGDQYRSVIAQHANIGNVELEIAFPGRVMRQWIVDLKSKHHDQHVFTSPVGSYTANAFGLYDMHGNVWEWCQDAYLDTFYDQFKQPGHQQIRPRAIDPLNTQPWNDLGDWRVIRGGSWFNSPVQVRSACRGYFEADDAACYLGFRLAMEVDEAQQRAAAERFARSEAARDQLQQTAQQLRERRDGILTVVARREHLSDAFFDALQQIDEPIDLDINAQGKLTGDHVATILRTKQLRGLTLSGTGPDLQDDDFAPLRGKPELEILHLTGTVTLSDALMDHLVNLQNLQSLTLHGDDITDEGLGKLPDMLQMKTLRLAGTQSTGAVLDQIQGAPLADFQCRHFRDADFQRLGRFATTLKSLDLSNSPISDRGLKEIVRLRRLNSLSLSQCSKLTDRGIAIVARLPVLETLRLRETAAADLTAEALTNANWLRNLQIASENLTNAGIDRLSEVVGLRSLEIAGDASSFDDAGFRNFWRCNQLNDFRLIAPGVTGTAMEPLQECPSLKRVTLAGPDIDDAGLKAIGQLRHTQSVTVGSRNILPTQAVSSAGLLGLANLAGGTRLEVHVTQLGLDDPAINRLRKLASHLEVSPR